MMPFHRIDVHTVNIGITCNYQCHLSSMQQSSMRNIPRKKYLKILLYLGALSFYTLCQRVLMTCTTQDINYDYCTVFVEKKTYIHP